MDPELVRAWLQLPVGPWPPDHYTLLDLTPDEADAGRVEQQVHERMEQVRRYQLIHPEAATEVMNRLAQALVCLTDPAAKRAYDDALFPDRPPAPSPPPVRLPATPPAPEPVPVAPDPLAWLFGPWSGMPATAAAPNPHLGDWEVAPPPPRRLPEPEPPPVGPAPADTVPMPETAAVAAPAAFTDPAPKPADPAAAAARLSEASRRGLGTKRALYYRIARTRQLLWAWEQAGKYLGHPKRMVSRPSQATELIAQMETIRELLRSFPPLLGEAGQPGYLVLALARQQMVVPTLQTLLPSQREALARDWQAGRALLTAHRQFLRGELRSLRGRNRLVQAMRGSLSALADHPGLVLLALALLALNLAFQELRGLWLRQVLALALLTGFRLTWWWLALRPTRVEKPRPVRPAKRALRPRPDARRQPRTSGT